MKSGKLMRVAAVGVVLVAAGVTSLSLRSDPLFVAGNAPPIAQSPLYLRDAVPPLNMLVMGKDHKIYYEAYNDASDLDGDGSLDVGYRGWELKANPAAGESRYKIDYYGYFNSYACYTWSTSSGGRFVPAQAAPDKTCGRRSGEWSGDFLNYLTTSRMDALRRVLYGGWRQTDTTTQTILQGAFFPQDAHSWGKEYQSIARDGYDIGNYAPLGIPDNGRYHLFAVTTTTGSANSFLFPNYQAPLFRVLKQSPYRVWNWLSIEGPVAGNSCFNAADQRVSCVGGGTAPAHPGHPADRAAFNQMEASFAIPSAWYGSGSVAQINCTNDACNPYGADDNYLTVITGGFQVGSGNSQATTFRFSVDGDDAVDFEIRRADGTSIQGGQAGYYGGHAVCDCNTYTTGVLNLNRGELYSIKFRHEDQAGGDRYILRYQVQQSNGQWSAWAVVPSSSGSGQTGLRNLSISTYNLRPVAGGVTRADYLVRVETCPAEESLRDTTCKVYPNGQAKPTGILHDYGESQRMYFGLITGSQRNNLEGGVLRRNISNFASEIDAATGVFRTDVEGIARSIDRLRMIGGGYNNNTVNNLDSDSNWNWNAGNANCPSVGSRVINNGECRMWGNPVAEMLYESMRYFAGATGATPRFATGGNTAGNEDDVLGLPTPAWQNPYASVGTGLNYPACSRPVQTIISDINPSYDGDLPGSAFAGAITTTGNTPASIADFNAASEGQAIWSAEFGAGSKDVFIGEVGGLNDGNPTVKSASGFGNIRGLSPEEPGKRGTYYTASVARFARNTPNINIAAEGQNVHTYSIALASPLPRIEFPVGSNTVTLVPFAKTVSGTYGDGARKPTNTIVDFYVEEYENFPGQAPNMTVNGGRPRAVFRINYEDVEQGNDHDMDAIVRYEIVANAGNTLTVNLTSEFAAGSANQNMGYIISGTTRDGAYLEVRDRDNGNQASSAYELNTPSTSNPVRWAGECVGRMNSAPCNQGLGFTSTRQFSPSTSTAAIQLRDPLWYAAKYGAPDPANWDSSAPGAPGHGDPDNYFLVTNPLNLRNQLSKAFDDIASRDVESGSRTLNGARVGADSFTLQPTFRRERNGKDWTGDLSALAINPNGSIGAVLWSAEASLPAPAARRIYTLRSAGNGTSGLAAGSRVPFLADSLGANEADQRGAIGVHQADIDNGEYGDSRDYSAEVIVSYLRGDRSRESTNGGTGALRARSSVIGSIINSEPVVASPRADLGYGMQRDPMFSGYVAANGSPGYLDVKARRETMAYVGANDGMLHGFYAGTVPCVANPRLPCAADGAGVERFAYVPNAVLKNMGLLAKSDDFYDHRYYVDGQLSVGDIKVGNGGATDWRTMLVGSTGAGARSVFALDVSDPSNLNENSIRWERNSSVDNDIGHVYGKPLIVPLEDGSWGVLFGNGYGGNLNDPSLYVLDAYTGAVIRKLTADDRNQGAVATNPVANWICQLASGFELVRDLCARRAAPFNGLGQITAIDKSGNGKVDTIYGGDLQGNLWKFDLSSSNSGNWGVANGGLPLFNAQINGEPQAITGGLRVAAGPGTGVMVYFGTGRYLFDRGSEPGDNDVSQDPSVQSLYAVFDNGTPVSNGRSALQAQSITGTGEGENGEVIRTISRTRVSYSGPNAKRGWYLDLQVYDDSGVTPGFRPIGERFIATPRIQSGRVFFTTFTPSEDSCNPGGDNFVYGLDLLSGSGALANVQVQPSQVPACTGADCGGIRVDGGGAPITSNSVAAITTNTVINQPDGSPCDPATMNCPTFEECQVVVYPGAFVLPRPCGRQSWRQIK